MSKRLAELLSAFLLVSIALPAAAQGFKVPVDYFTLPNGLKVVVSEDHAALLGALERRDAPAARAIAEAHILDAGEALGEWLRSRADGRTG